MLLYYYYNFRSTIFVCISNLLTVDAQHKAMTAGALSSSETEKWPV